MENAPRHPDCPPGMAITLSGVPHCAASHKLFKEYGSINGRKGQLIYGPSAPLQHPHGMGHNGIYGAAPPSGATGQLQATFIPSVNGPYGHGTGIMFESIGSVQDGVDTGRPPPREGYDWVVPDAWGCNTYFGKTITVNGLHEKGVSSWKLKIVGTRDRILVPSPGCKTVQGVNDDKGLEDKKKVQLVWLKKNANALGTAPEDVNEYYTTPKPWSGYLMLITMFGNPVAGEHRVHPHTQAEIAEFRAVADCNIWLQRCTE